MHLGLKGKKRDATSKCRSFISLNLGRSRRIYVGIIHKTFQGEMKVESQTIIVRETDREGIRRVFDAARGMTVDCQSCESFV